MKINAEFALFKLGLVCICSFISIRFYVFVNLQRVQPGFALENNSRAYRSSRESCIGIPVKVGHSNFGLSGTSIVSISTCQPEQTFPSKQTFGIISENVNLHKVQIFTFFHVCSGFLAITMLRQISSALSGKCKIHAFMPVKQVKEKARYYLKKLYIFCSINFLESS